jgi:hypothetical protein
MFSSSNNAVFFPIYNGLTFNTPAVKVEVKHSFYRPGVAQMFTGRFPDFMTTAQDGGKVVSLIHWLPLPPGNASGTHF